MDVDIPVTDLSDKVVSVSGTLYVKDAHQGEKERIARALTPFFIQLLAKKARTQFPRELYRGLGPNLDLQFDAYDLPDDRVEVVYVASCDLM